MINEALRLIRVFHDLKQNELAEKLEVSKSHISEIENGRKVPSLDLIKRYSNTFKMPVSSIMFFAEQLPSAEAGDGLRLKIASKAIKFLRLVESMAAEEDVR